MGLVRVLTWGEARIMILRTEIPRMFGLLIAIANSEMKHVTESIRTYTLKDILKEMVRSHNES